VRGERQVQGGAVPVHGQGVWRLQLLRTRSDELLRHQLLLAARFLPAPLAGAHRHQQVPLHTSPHLEPGPALVVAAVQRMRIVVGVG